MSRRKLQEEIANLYEYLLPRKAQKTGDYPVHLDHCFKRLGYDEAVGAEWTTEVRSPFIANASTDLLRAVVRHGELMLEDPEYAHVLQNRSMARRFGNS